MNTISKLVRKTDPPESAEAAAKVDLSTGRTLMLRAFFNSDSPITFFEAAVKAVTFDEVFGTSNKKVALDKKIARLESLRRRGSDLRERGLIEQAGRKAGRATFTITDKGRKVLNP